MPPTSTPQTPWLPALPPLLSRCPRSHRPRAPPRASTHAPLCANDRAAIHAAVCKPPLGTVGGSIVQLELLKHTDQNATARNVLLFDQGPKRL